MAAKIRRMTDVVSATSRTKTAPVRVTRVTSGHEASSSAVNSPRSRTRLLPVRALSSAAVPDATHVFCFDDDAVVREDYLEQAVAFFNTHPDVVAVTGRVEDGVVETAELFALHDDRLERSGGYPSHPERFGLAGYDLAALLTAGGRG